MVVAVYEPSQQRQLFTRASARYRELDKIQAGTGGEPSRVNQLAMGVSDHR
jgi:hypothetical protein